MERKNDNRIVDKKESLKGSCKESVEDRYATCPTLLVLRQEDGAVRPEKKIVRRAALWSQNETKTRK